jgi:hypothetical protein
VSITTTSVRPPRAAADSPTRILGDKRHRGEYTGPTRRFGNRSGITSAGLKLNRPLSRQNRRAELVSVLLPERTARSGLGFQGSAAPLEARAPAKASKQVRGDEKGRPLEQNHTPSVLCGTAFACGIRGLGFHDHRVAPPRKQHPPSCSPLHRPFDGTPLIEKRDRDDARPTTSTIVA